MEAIKYEGICFMCGAIIIEKDFLDDIEYRAFLDGCGCGVCQEVLDMGE